MKVIKGILAALGVMFIGFILFFVLVFFGLGSMVSGGLSEFGASDLDLASLNIKTDHAVGVAELEGEIISSKGFVKSLKKLVENEKINAIVVRIDSPGGAVGASEEIFSAIKQADKKKPVVCSLSSIAASGGIYSAMGCRKIIANRGTLTGSIGVIMMSPNVGDLIKEYGVKMTVIKSGKYKDSGSPFRTVTDGDRAILQNVVDSAYEQFVDVIAQSRGLEHEAVKKFADGRVITGDQAKELGLIDETGDLNRAAKVALEFSGDDAEPEIILPKKPTNFMALLEQTQESRLYHWISSLGRTQLLYRAFL